MSKHCVALKMQPVDIFFDVLEKTNSTEKAMDAVKKAIIKRKLEVNDNNRSYEEVNEVFHKILLLLKKEEILSKLIDKP